MMPACLQTQDSPDIPFPLVGTLSVCMEIAPNPLMEDYNGSMSSDRISIEWIFGVISNYFQFVDFKKTEDGLKPSR